MRIAMLAPISVHSFRDYKPWEEVVYSLTTGLIAKGLDVTLFAVGDYQAEGKLISVCSQNQLENSISSEVWECLHISELFERAGEFDLIHNNFEFLPLTYSRLVKTPIITSIHDIASPAKVPVYEKYNSTGHYVAVSEANKSPELNYLTTIYPGVDLKIFTFKKPIGDYLLFLDSIHPDMGVKEAIEIANRASMKLIIAGKVRDGSYFQREVVPYIDGDSVVYMGVPDTLRKDELLGGAYALLHPINFAESFSLSILEAMACGTPVVAFNKGAMAEFISNGVNGFLAADIEEAVDVIPSVRSLDRRSCRDTVEKKFTVEKMVQEYIEAYERVLFLCNRRDKRPWGYYEVLFEAAEYKVKRITVMPETRLSLQSHEWRSEHWMIVMGDALVTCGDKQVVLKPGESIDIPQKTVHRIQNSGPTPMIFVEIQQGHYLGEDDIIRLDDDYSRR